MSSQTGNARFHDGVNHVEESQIEEAIRDVQRISDSTDSDFETWEQRIVTGRTVIRTLGATGFMQQPNRRDQRIFVISSLQRLAYHEADGSSVDDIAQWCMEQWLSLLRTDAADLDALRGMPCHIS